MIRQIIFALDGTLSNTSFLQPAQRTPATILKACPPDGDVGSFSFGDEVSRLPGRLIVKGYEVGILTTSPIAYASTLLGLLNIDYQAISTNAGSNVIQRAHALTQLIRKMGSPASETLYVASEPGDANVARSAGCQYAYPEWVNGGSIRLEEVARRAPGRDQHADGSPKVPSSGPGVLDLAAGRLRTGTATQEDAQLLYDSGLWAVLHEYDGVRLLDDDRSRAGLSQRTRPWDLMLLDKRAWNDFASSGDIGRLLNIPADQAASHLPDATLDASVQRLVDQGAVGELLQDWNSLSPAVQRKIARPSRRDHPHSRIRSAVIEYRALSRADIDFLRSGEHSPAVAAAMAGLALRRRPQQEFRRDLQEIVLNGVDASAQLCILKLISSDEGRTTRDKTTVVWSPRIFTHAEIADDPSLQTLFISAIGRIFPPRLVGYNLTRRTHCCVPYDSKWGREVLGTAKEWTQTKEGHFESGPHPHLGLMWLPAMAVAASITALYGTDTVIVPVPSSPFSDSQPAEFSNRLAFAAGRYAGVEVHDILEKDATGIKVRRKLSGRKIVFVDDQYTSGNTLIRAWKALNVAGLGPSGAITWSASDPDERPQPESDIPCWWTEAAGTLGLAAKCPTHDDPTYVPYRPRAANRGRTAKDRRLPAF